MDKICELCIIWEENGNITKQSLLTDSLYNIDKLIKKKNYNSSENIRNSKEYKPIIDEFLKNKKLTTRNYRGNIVIMDGEEKVRVMYEPRIKLIKRFLTLLTTKMKRGFDKTNPNRYKDKTYAREFIKKHPYLFTEDEKIGLFTGLKYDKKLLFENTLNSWKKRSTKEKDNPAVYDNMRKLYKHLVKDMNNITNELLTVLESKVMVSDMAEDKNPIQIEPFNLRKAKDIDNNDDDELDEFDEEIKHHLDEGLRITHVDKYGKIIGSEKYSDYLERENNEINDIEEERKRFK